MKKREPPNFSGPSKQKSGAQGGELSSAISIRSESGNSNSNLADDETFFSERDREPEDAKGLCKKAQGAGKLAAQ